MEPFWQRYWREQTREPGRSDFLGSLFTSQGFLSKTLGHHDAYLEEIQYYLLAMVFAVL